MSGLLYIDHALDDIREESSDELANLIRLYELGSYSERVIC